MIDKARGKKLFRRTMRSQLGNKPQWVRAKNGAVNAVSWRLMRDRIVVVAPMCMDVSNNTNKAIHCRIIWIALENRSRTQWPQSCKNIAANYQTEIKCQPGLCQSIIDSALFGRVWRQGLL